MRIAGEGTVMFAIELRGIPEEYKDDVKVCVSSTEISTAEIQIK